MCVCRIYNLRKRAHEKEIATASDSDSDSDSDPDIEVLGHEEARTYANVFKERKRRERCRMSKNYKYRDFFSAGFKHRRTGIKPSS